MSFGSFLAKAAKFAGKAIVAVASEVINKGPLQINKQYLDKISSLSLDGYQRSAVERARRLNEKAVCMKREQSELSGKIKNINVELENLKTKEKEFLIEAVQVAKKLPIKYDEQDKKGADLILSINTDDIEGVSNDIADEFNKSRALYLDEVDRNSDLTTDLEERIAEHEMLLKEKKADYQDFFPELRDAIQNVKSFGDVILREHNEKMTKR